MTWGALRGLSEEERRAHKRSVHKVWRAKNAEHIHNYQTEYRAKDPEKARVDNAIWRKKNIDHVRAKNRVNKLKSMYGLTVPALEAMKQAQAFRCLLCDKEKPLNVDHCHKTGQVRGLLCTDCNTSLGKFNDDPNMLRRATAYLEGTL
jgi:hypothetical protein